jgi:hypothetical protein
MKNSKATNEIRDIRDRLSLHLLTLTPEERSKEFQGAVDNFERATGRSVTTVNNSRSGKVPREELAQV